jgi:hypothetical protein
VPGAPSPGVGRLGDGRRSWCRYYFLKSVNLWPKFLPPLFITLAQISQMFVGVFITAKAFQFSKDPTCEVNRPLIPWCCAMYATYLYFFVEVRASRF